MVDVAALRPGRGPTPVGPIPAGSVGSKEVGLLPLVRRGPGVDGVAQCRSVGSSLQESGWCVRRDRPQTT